MIWELRCAKIYSFAPLVLLDAKGAVQDWKNRPAFEFFAEPKKKPASRQGASGKAG